MKIRFVLSHPAVPENIGAAARALVTCGFDELVLVNPVGHDDEKARWLAVGAGEVLAGARICGSLAEAIVGVDLVIGTTARHRSFPRPLLDSVDLPRFLAEKGDPDLYVALVFGSEQNGLKNDELELCQIVTTVSIAAPYPSLNLAQSVMVFAYELSRARLVPRRDEEATPDGALRLARDQAPEISPVALGTFMELSRAILDLAGIPADVPVRRRLIEYVSRFNSYEMGAFHCLWARLLKRR